MVEDSSRLVRNLQSTSSVETKITAEDLHEEKIHISDALVSGNEQEGNSNINEHNRHERKKF